MPHYISRKELASLVKEAQRNKGMTDDLALAVCQITEGLHQRYRFHVEVEDLKQNVCLSLLTTLQRIDTKQNVFSYITTVAFNEAVFMVRESGREWKKCQAIAARLLKVAN